MNKGRTVPADGRRYDDDDKCLAPGCTNRLPGEGGRFKRAKAAGWRRSYCGTWGTGFICPDHP